jgi:ABC-2 type transport system permease protein
MSQTEVLTRSAIRFPVSTRLYRSELGLVFRRRRNQALLVFLGAIPVLIGVAVRLSSHTGDGGNDGGSFINQVAGNGVFLSVAALFFLLPLILPLAVAVVAGDTIAGEASIGTLRYLLTVPAGRTRLLAVKYLAALTYCLAIVIAVAGMALLTGVILFPVGPVTLLSGTTVSLLNGLGRLGLIALYVVAALGMIAAIGVAFSTLTDHPIGAITATAVLPVGSEVMDAVPQLGWLHPYLFSHYWFTYDDLLRSPMVTTQVTHGLVVYAAYAFVFGAFAWSRFTTKDITC